MRVIASSIFRVEICQRMAPLHRQVSWLLAGCLAGAIFGAGSLQSAEPLLLITPSMQGDSYLVAPGGEVRHVWPSKLMPAGPGRIDGEGALLRVERDEHLPPSFKVPGGGGGKIVKTGWDGMEQWSFSVATPKNLVHHDAVALPNGNVLALVWERHEPAEAEARGRNKEKVGKAGLWSECLWELKPQGKSGARIVWEWKAWNHARRLPEAAMPRHLRHFEPGERININGGRTPSPAWAGVTRLEYNSELDQVLLVAAGMGGVWILDHSTTTQEAATDAGGKGGKGGRLMYQWDGTTADLKASGRRAFVVDAEWVQDKENKAPMVEVLRGVQGEDGRVVYATERWELPRHDGGAGYAMEDTGEYAMPILKRTTAVPLRDSSDLLERPTALTTGRDGFSGLTYGYAGLTKWSLPDAGTSTMKEHRNEAGKTTLKVSVPSPNSLLCCGGDSPGKKGDGTKKPAAPIRTFTSAPVLKSRLVSETSFVPPAVSAKGPGISEPQAASATVSTSTR